MSVQDHLLSEGCVVNFEGYVEAWYFVVHFSVIVTLLSTRWHNLKYKTNQHKLASVVVKYVNGHSSCKMEGIPFASVKTVGHGLVGK